MMTKEATRQTISRGYFPACGPDRPTKVFRDKSKELVTWPTRCRPRCVFDESEMPTHWYNIVADLPTPLPHLHQVLFGF